MIRRLVIVLLVSLGLSACATVPVTPETPRETLVSAEAAYEFALLEVRSLIVSGYIKPNTQTATYTRMLIVETREALDAWHVSPDDPSAADIATVILRKLQAQVARMLLTQEAHKGDSLIGDESGVMA
jgi:hypothetical protein